MLTGYYLGLGVVMAVWGARMPSIQKSADLSTAQLSLVMLAAALGMVAGLQTGGRLTRPDRVPLLLTSGAVGLAGSLAVLGQCDSLPTLSAVALLFGLTHGVLDVAVNTAAVRCQNAYGRPIMSGLHASYSIGALAGAALAAVTARTAHSLLFLITGLALAVAALAAIPGARSTTGGEDPSSSGRDADQRLPRDRIWLLGALAAATLLGEGAAADWAAVHLDGLHASTALSAAAYACYSAAMATGRLTGDRLTAAFGARLVVQTGALLAAAGLAAGVLVPTTAVALAGWTLFGLGLSLTVPCLISAAGAGGPQAVATVSVTGYLGLLAGPALIGAIATLTSLPTALLLPALLAAAVAFLSRRALEPHTS
ncbi:MFS transporter [Streptomyces sp. UH6]|nr:MFS transporter [Streptomyces sp. UH6]